MSQLILRSSMPKLYTQIDREGTHADLCSTLDPPSPSKHAVPRGPYIYRRVNAGSIDDNREVSWRDRAQTMWEGHNYELRESCRHFRVKAGCPVHIYTVHESWSFMEHSKKWISISFVWRTSAREIRDGHLLAGCTHTSAFKLSCWTIIHLLHSRTHRLLNKVALVLDRASESIHVVCELRTYANIAITTHRCHVVFGRSVRVDACIAGTIFVLKPFLHDAPAKFEVCTHSRYAKVTFQLSNVVEVEWSQVIDSSCI